MGVSQLSITWGYGVINRSREATFDWDSFGASCVVRLHFSFDLLKHQSSTQMALKLLTSTLSQPIFRLVSGWAVQRKSAQTQNSVKTPSVWRGCGSTNGSAKRPIGGRWLKGTRDVWPERSFSLHVPSALCSWQERPLVRQKTHHKFPCQQLWFCQKKWSLPIFVFYCVMHKYVKLAEFESLRLPLPKHTYGFLCRWIRRRQSGHHDGRSSPSDWFCQHCNQHLLSVDRIKASDRNHDFWMVSSW